MINHKEFYLALLNNMQPFYDRNEITCKILFYLQLGSVLSNKVDSVGTF